MGTEKHPYDFQMSLHRTLELHENYIKCLIKKEYSLKNTFQ